MRCFRWEKEWYTEYMESAISSVWKCRKWMEKKWFIWFWNR